MLRNRWRVVSMSVAMCLALVLGSCGQGTDDTASETSGSGDSAEATDDQSSSVSQSTSSAGEQAGSGEVVVYDGGGAWGEAQRIAFFEPFEEETGIDVIPAVSPPISATQTAIEAGDPGLDVYSLADNRITSWSDADYLEPIDFSSWPDGRREDFAPYDVLDIGVPYYIYAVQIAYDPEAVDPITSWADFWDTQQFPGPRSLSDLASNLAGGTIEIALLADGVAADELYPLNVERAFDKLDELKPDLVNYWVEGAEPIQAMIDGQVVASSAYNGRIVAAQEEGATLGSDWNQALLAAHYYTIPKGAANLENANRFIEFASRPEQQAVFAENITYSPANQEAYESITPERQALLPTAPDTIDQTIVTNPDFWNSESPSGEPWNEAIIEMWNDWLAEG